MLKENKGITLVALIITIIVMLILAGVSISLVLGEDGVLRQANSAKYKTAASSIQTAFSMSFADLTTNYLADSAVYGTSNGEAKDSTEVKDTRASKTYGLDTYTDVSGNTKLYFDTSKIIKAVKNNGTTNSPDFKGFARMDAANNIIKVGEINTKEVKLATDQFVFEVDNCVIFFMINTDTNELPVFPLSVKGNITVIHKDDPDFRAGGEYAKYKAALDALNATTP